VSFLHGQLSQDIVAIGLGESAWSLLLQPSGKVNAWLRVTRAGEEEVLLDVEGGHADAVVARLQRFKLRTKADIEPLDWGCVAVRGQGADHHAPPDARPTVWPGIEGFDLVGPEVAVPAGIGELGLDAYDLARIEAGVPAMGSELTETTIPGEVGQWLLDTSVSFTKGCYTGQELVARIDSRGGNVARHLRGLLLDTQADVPVGAEVVADEKVVGKITSVARSMERDATIALAFLGRAVSPGAKVDVRWDAGAAVASVEDLPLIG
jgi:folate-binding protein YgfZ